MFTTRRALSPSQPTRPGGIEDNLIAERFVCRSEEGVIDSEKGKLRGNHGSKVAFWHRIIRAASQNRSKSAQELREMAAAVFMVLECPDVSTVSGALGTCDLDGLRSTLKKSHRYAIPKKSITSYLPEDTFVSLKKMT